MAFFKKNEDYLEISIISIKKMFKVQNFSKKIKMIKFSKISVFIKFPNFNI